MIFSKFFKPSWQHKDSSVRIEAINNELSLNVDEHYNTLMEIVKHDESELVRRAALLKINSLSVWYDASQSNSMNSVRSFAEKQVEKVLLGQHDIKLTTKDKKQFVGEKLKPSLLETWLKAESDPQIVVALFKRINKPQLLHSVFKQHQNEEVQVLLLHDITKGDGLDKLMKVAVNNNVKSLIEEILIKEKEQLEKPKKLTKAAQLVLSKYLALRDAKDYALAIKSRQALLEEWQHLIPEFCCLESEQRDAFIGRFNEIELTVQKALAPQAEAFEQEKIAQELAAKRVEVMAHFNELKLAVDQKITQAIFDNSAIDEESTTQDIDQLITQVESSIITSDEKAKLVNKLLSVKTKLQKLPEVAEAVSSATHLISKMSQVSFPNSVEQLDEKQLQYRDWKSEWREVSKKASGVLPESIQNAYLEIKNSWDEALAPLIQEQKKQFHVTQRKIKDVSRLINSGKYNAAFGVFKKARAYYENLSEFQQSKLKRDYDTVTEKISELSDWEHYIATPRKKEILEQVADLAENPLANPSEQADKVKSFRKLWNSVGHADDEIEHELNEQFNLLSEKAFAPCRQYYAEQEKLRESHLALRQQIVDEAKSLAAQPINDHFDWKQYETQFNRLKQNWRDAGEVDRVAYRELNKAFKNSLAPIRKNIEHKHLQSVEAKQALIAHASTLLASSDLGQAVNEVKELQVKWKALGYSGPKHENTLWKEFRKINDELFARRSEEFEENKKVIEQFEENCNKKINETLKLLDNNDLESVLMVTRNLKSLKKQLDSQDKGAKVVEKQFKIEFQKLAKLEQKLRAKVDAENWKLVFDALNFMLEEKVSNFQKLNDISPRWQKRLLEMDEKHEAEFHARRDRTLVLEILAGKESPESEQNKRLEIQLAMMQEQMNSGQLNSVEQGLADWLAVGAITMQDKSLIDRVQAIFVK